MWKEFAGFLSARLFSLLVDMGLMYLFVSAMGMREMIAKFIVQIVIVIINYVFSKLFIFRNRKISTTSAHGDRQRTLLML